MSDQKSIWKKELKLGKRAASATPDAGTAPSVEQRPTSVWKKELSVRKKPKNEEKASKKNKPKAGSESLERVSGPGGEVPSPRGSIWKKELRMRRAVPARKPEPDLLLESAATALATDLGEIPVAADPPAQVEPFAHRAELPTFAPETGGPAGTNGAEAGDAPALESSSDAPDIEFRQDIPGQSVDPTEERGGYEFGPYSPAFGDERESHEEARRDGYSSDFGFDRSDELSPTEPVQAFEVAAETPETPAWAKGLPSNELAPAEINGPEVEEPFAPRWTDYSQPVGAGEGGDTAVSAVEEPVIPAWHDYTEPVEPGGFVDDELGEPVERPESVDSLETGWGGYSLPVEPPAAESPATELSDTEFGESTYGDDPAPTESAYGGYMDFVEIPNEDEAHQAETTFSNELDQPGSAGHAAVEMLDSSSEHDPHERAVAPADPSFEQTHPVPLVAEPDEVSERDEVPVHAVVEAAAVAGAAVVVGDDQAEDVLTPKKKDKKRKSDGGGKQSAAGKAGAQVVGVRVGSSQIVAAVVRNADSGPELLQLVSAPLERGIIVAGEVREPEALAAELKRMFSKHKLPRKGIRLGVASSRVGVRILEVPPIDDPKAFENAIKFRAQELLPIPLGDAILDHVVLGETQAEDAPMLRVLIAFAHRELVDRYAEAFKSARLKVASVDVEAFALLRAVGPRENGTDNFADRATVAVAVGQERTIFAVAEGKICDFTRVLEWGGGSLTVAAARALDLTPSQAEPLKRMLTLDGGAGEAELAPEQLEAAREAMRAEIQALARELLASLQFYQSRPGSLAIGEVLLTGGGASLGGLTQELQERLRVPVRAVDPFEHVHAGKKVKIAVDQGAAAIAIGLGMEG